jgi:hypothetical protein
MSALSTWLIHKSKGWLALALAVIMVAFMIWVLPDQAAKAEAVSQGAGSIDTSFFYAPEQLFEIAEAYGEAGRQAYIRARWTFDLAFPLVYGGFLISVTGWLLGKSTSPGSKLRWLIVVPLIGVVFDFLENTAASLVMGVYPTRLGWAAFLASVFTLIKWIFVYGGFIVLVAAFIVWLVGRRKRALSLS